MIESPSVNYPIPAKRNLAIAIAQVVGLLSLLALSGAIHSWWALSLLTLGYALLMNSAYALLHEAEHGLFHPNRRLNDFCGAALALFFPAPFHLLRQGHIGHHLRNRSDDEAFDFYFEGESRVWKYLQFYGILTGLFWLTVVASNLIALVLPKLLTARWADFDRPTQSLLESLNPRYMRLIRIEAAAAIILHLAWLLLWSIPLSHYALLLCGFGFLWSTLQYVHHYGTERTVLKGAKNLQTWNWLDRLWLNHNWHKNHHAHPLTPWTHLPEVGSDGDGERERLLSAYIRMWKGPRFTSERISNHYAGKIIR